MMYPPQAQRELANELAPPSPRRSTARQGVVGNFKRFEVDQSHQLCTLCTAAAFRG